MDKDTKTHGLYALEGWAAGAREGTTTADLPSITTHSTRSRFVYPCPRVCWRGEGTGVV